MKLFTSVKGWKDKNSDKRLKWVAKSNPLNSKHQEILTSLTIDDNDIKVRENAFEKLINKEKVYFLEPSYLDLILQIAINTKTIEFHEKAIRKLDDHRIIEWIDRVENSDEYENQMILARLVKHNEWKIREKVLEKLKDQKALRFVVIRDYKIHLRVKALEKITDQLILLEIAKSADREPIRLKAFNKIIDQKILEEYIYDTKNDFGFRIIAISKLKNQKTIEDIILRSKFYTLKIHAIENLHNQDLLKKIALNDENINHRKKAIKNIYDESILIDIINTNDNRVQQMKIINLAVEKIYNQDILMRIYKNRKKNGIKINSILKNFSNQNILEDISINGNSKSRKISIEKLENNEILKNLFTNPSKDELKFAVVAMEKYYLNILESMNNEEFTVLFDECINYLDGKYNHLITLKKSYFKGGSNRPSFKTDKSFNRIFDLISKMYSNNDLLSETDKKKIASYNSKIFRSYGKECWIELDYHGTNEYDRIYGEVPELKFELSYSAINS